jgi:prepilin peptidase CpaA
MRSLAWWPTLVVLAVATFTDLRTRRIPNWLVFPFLLAGVVISPWRPDWSGSSRSFGWHGLGQSFAGLGLGLLVYGILFWLGGMGSGDVKLCAAIGAWIGPEQTFWAVFYTALAGGIMAMCWIAYHKIFRKLFRYAGNLVLGRTRSKVDSDAENSLDDLLKRKMPYAPAITLGTLVSFFAR